MARATDLKVVAAGSSHSLIGQQMYASGAYRTLKGGTAVYTNGQWYIYSEALNAQVSLAVASATQIDFTFQSLPSAPFRPEGLYLIHKNTLEVQLRFSGQMHFTDDSAEAYQYTTDPLPCDGAKHFFSDTTSVPSGKELYQVDIDAVEVLFSSEGLDGWAYRQGDVPVETIPRRFTAYAAVSPLGSGTASATPSDPLYGQLVTFLATDGNGYKFTRWASGRTSRSYAIQAFGDLSDTAVFASLEKVIDFSLIFYIDASSRVCIEARSLQNKSAEAFATLSLDLTYLDGTGAEHTLTGYTFEVVVDGQDHLFVLDQTSDAAQILAPSAEDVEVTPPGDFVTGELEIMTDMNQYAIEVNSADPAQGSASATPDRVPRNGTSLVKATPASGYVFSRWAVHTPAEASFTLSGIREHYTDTAYFTPRTFTLQALVASGQGAMGTAKVSPTSVQTGGTATWTATPNTGYKFVRWSFSDGTTSAQASTVKSGISQNLTGTASFAAATVTVDMTYSLMYDADSGCYRADVVMNPNPSGAAQFAFQFELSFSDGDFEAFEGALSGSGRIVSSIPYREDKPLEGASVTVQSLTEGYLVGDVSGGASYKTESE